MDANTINGIVRAVVPAFLAYAVGKGWLTQSSVADVSAAITAIAAAVWSVMSNQNSGTKQ